MFKFKQFGLDILLGLCGIFFALGLGEIGLRIARISYPSFYQVDEYRGHALIPGVSGWWIQEGNGWVKVNKDGLRDKYYTKEKPKDTFRIAILGDSFAEAIQVNLEETFWSFIEQELRNCPSINNQTVEAINFGVGDYGTAQELMTLKHQVKHYSPDMVILAIFTGNDIVNNSKILSYDDRFSPFLIEQEGKFVMDFSFKKTKTYQWRSSLSRKIIFSIINNFHLLQMINKARIAFKNSHSFLDEYHSNNDSINFIKYLDFVPELYLNNEDENWEKAWDITEELVKMIRQESETIKAKFLAVTLSNPAQVYPDKSLRDKYFKQKRVVDEFSPDKRIKALGEKEKFYVLNLAPEFQFYADKNNQFLHGFENTVLGSGHWNQLGHKLAGKLITNKVCKML
ncbi:MAG: SGNH/GDSL hydrolase family protein [cyanobacterium endosymbiont of Rhopalodia musculus]|uniref:SGNH/GDSL hydrolase family protein n=1 Tax=cyanobacterium endosymbiont of Epithemia clementina EcSB TaxID=3034674 RepID=UPI0024800B42|nr:SGNH/GDSL hydrolase family protein [cyanobacterium endosymbiont of Epithemia clementina EcSB]WGT66738.1 SGNH/GDSL hydrolase family protein [cyanobacterium endosymbiont of Epithemia clementina EcSB]